MDELRTSFKTLINQVLPSTYNTPIRFNHCFNRVILDWLFHDVWYNHADRNKTAISQLNEDQLQRAIDRMNEWLRNHDTLIKDNLDSLQYRRKVM